MLRFETYSRTGSEELLKQNGIIDDIHEIPPI